MSAYASTTSDDGISTHVRGQGPMRTVHNSIAYTTLNPRFPAWARFRGAEYKGAATHDPLAQNLAANFLARGALSAGCSRSTLLRIAFYAAAGDGLLSARTKLYALVCLPDADGARLLAAGRLSRQLRRLLDNIPRELPLAIAYQDWTREVADFLCLIRPCKLAYFHICNVREDTNRLLVASMDEDFVYVHRHKDEMRPAYFPSAATLESWCAAAFAANSAESLVRGAEQIQHNATTTTLLLKQYIMRNFHRGMFLSGSCTPWTLRMHQDAEAACAFQTRVQRARLNAELAQIASEIYYNIYALGLNGAESDWFYMISPGVHF